MHTDQTALTRTFGLHAVQAEIGDILTRTEGISPGEVSAKREEILGYFDTPDPECDPHTSKLSREDLEKAATTAVALDRFIADFDLDGLAYYYRGVEGSEVRGLAESLIVGNSLLSARGFAMCGESDLKTCVAMLIMDRLDIGGSFAEFHPVDFNSDTVLVGHDGPHHIRIAEGRPTLRSLSQYHGKPGSGASVEFQIKNGPITMLSLTSTAEGAFKFVIAEGESVPRKIPATGNTNTHGRFGSCVRTFLKRWFAEGPTHHLALGVGHHAEDLCLVAKSLGIEHAHVRGLD